MKQERDINRAVKSSNAQERIIHPSLCHNATPLLDHFTPLSPHALSQRQREHILDAITSLRRAFYILGSDLFRDCCTALCWYRSLTLSTQHTSCLLVSSKICLGSNKDQWCSFTEMRDFWIPLNTAFSIFVVSRAAWSEPCPEHSLDSRGSQWRTR